METSDRTLLLDRIRAALADVPASERPEDVEVPRAYHRAASAGASSVDPETVDLFAERAADYRAHVTRTAAGSLADAIAQRLAARGIERLVVPPGFPDVLPCPTSAAGGRRVLIRDAPALSTAELDDADGVVTTCALAIAQTGTVVLDAGPGQGRRALSLLPDYHLCVVRFSQIVPDVPAALRALTATRPITLISGPSATSDIENDRVEGVHGPRTLDILIVDRPDQAGPQP